MATVYGPGSENFLLNLKCVIKRKKTDLFYGSLQVEFKLLLFIHGTGVCFL